MMKGVEGSSDASLELVVANCTGKLEGPAQIVTIKAGSGWSQRFRIRQGLWCCSCLIKLCGLCSVPQRRIIARRPPGDVSVLPELMALLGKEFVFKLRMGNYNVIGGFQNYPVSGVFTLVASWEIDYAGALSAQALDGAGPSPAHGGTTPGVNRSGKRKHVLTDRGDGGSDDDIGIECLTGPASQ